MRKETINDEAYIEDINENTTHYAKVLLYIQKALLGKVTPSLRQISVNNTDDEKKIIGIYIYYDGEISAEDYTLAQAIICDTAIFFPGYQIDKLIQRVDYPERIICEGTRVAFARYEYRERPPELKE